MPLDPSTIIARKLRRDATEVERRMWRLLRSRTLDGWKFRRQHPIEHFVADFACLADKLVIELDGSQHADRAPQDAERTSVLARRGWRVLRFWNTEVMENAEGVADTILAELLARRQPPATSPSHRFAMGPSLIPRFAAERGCRRTWRQTSDRFSAAVRSCCRRASSSASRPGP